jgi:hypothetical protein
MSIKAFEKQRKRAEAAWEEDQENGGDREWFNQLPPMSRIMQGRYDDEDDYSSSDKNEWKREENPWQHATLQALSNVKHDYDRKWINVNRRIIGDANTDMPIFFDTNLETFKEHMATKYHKIFTGEVNLTDVQAAVDAGALDTFESTCAFLKSLEPDNRRRPCPLPRPSKVRRKAHGSPRPLTHAPLGAGSARTTSGSGSTSRAARRTSCVWSRPSRPRSPRGRPESTPVT